MTTIAEFFSGISKSKCPTLMNKVSKANSVPEFYDKCIKANLPDVEVVKGWHELLKKYIEEKDAFFFVRRYASGKDKAGNWDIRRGFLTVYDNVKYVFVDNFFAQYFYAMAINDFVPEYNDFKRFVHDREIPYGYSVVSQELGHQAFKKGPVYPLNRNGWKLSHVFSANGKDYNYDYKSTVSTLFPKGEYSDYISQKGFTYPLRRIEQHVSDEDKKRIKAHFLRVVHPLNHFLTPMVKYQHSTAGIQDIGEFPEMIDYMKFKLAKRYGCVFTEYMELIMAPGVISSFSPIGIEYGMGLGKVGTISIKPISKSVSTKATVAPIVKSHKTTSKTRTKRIPFTDKQIAETIKAYLFDGMSFRVIEYTYLGMPKRTNGGGWAAKNLLENKGLDSTMKNMFSGRTVADAIALSSEPLKSTLIWMDANL